MRERVLSYVRQHELLRAGDRVGVAVSGGADSVSLLRLLLDMRADLGVVLAVVHFNHQIRGADADADQRFVAQLADTHRLELHVSSADTRAHARAHGMSLEAAGRELRYRYLSELLATSAVTRIATAHTLDDQAETVLLRILRGAGTRGIAGIYPRRVLEGGDVVRPLLEARRTELRSYLNSLGQSWREDASNLDVRHTRNRVRHQLLPLLEREFNPAVVQILSEMAEVARAEEEFWDAEVRRLLASARSPEPEARLARTPLLRQPLALQRRLVRAMAEQTGGQLDFQHVEQVLAAAVSVQLLEAKEVELPGGCVVAITAQELCWRRGRLLQQRVQYEYRLPVPGEAAIAERGSVIRVSLLAAGQVSDSRADLLDPQRLAPELVVRNWHPGDRFWPAHSKAPAKVKELLLRRRLPQPQRSSWPVVVSGDTVVWVSGLGAAADFRPGDQAGEVAVIEEVTAVRSTE